MKIEKSVTIQNKRARFEYEILEDVEAGIVLTGTEIKSLRSSKASIAESFCQFIDGELYVINMMIDEYKLGTFYNHKIIGFWRWKCCQELKCVKRMKAA